MIQWEKNAAADDDDDDKRYINGTNIDMKTKMTITKT